MTKCEYCSEKIRKKEDRIKKYHYLLADAYGNHKVSYWHPWCWKLEQKRYMYKEYLYSDEDPRLKRLKKIQDAKEAYLKA